MGIDRAERWNSEKFDLYPTPFLHTCTERERERERERDHSRMWIPPSQRRRPQNSSARCMMLCLSRSSSQPGCHNPPLQTPSSTVKKSPWTRYNGPSRDPGHTPPLALLMAYLMLFSRGAQHCCLHCKTYSTVAGLTLWFQSSGRWPQSN